MSYVIKVNGMEVGVKKLTTEEVRALEKDQEIVLVKVQ